MPAIQHVLTLSCPNRPGIVAAVSTFLFEAGANIAEGQQYDDPESQRFFARILFDHPAGEGDEAALRAGVPPIAERFRMDWPLRNLAEQPRVMLLVSRFDHCLADILYRWRIGELPMVPAAIVSNHPRETFAHLDFDGIPFPHLPVTRTTKMEQESAIWALV